MEIEESPRMKLTRIEREFNTVRYDLYNKVSRYFRQSIVSNYTTENDILEGLNKCKDLRDEYMSLKKELNVTV